MAGEEQSRELDRTELSLDERLGLGAVKLDRSGCERNRGGWRTEPEDPHFSYYGDAIGDLSLEDPISFRGSIFFRTGMTDAAVYFGYFNSREQVKTLSRGDPDGGFPRKNMLGILIGDSTAVGYYFIGMLRAKSGGSIQLTEKVFTPTRRHRHFTFRYDPTANKGVGRITYTLDDETFVVNVTPKQREAGASFDRFGFANVRRGGHSVELYLDDLTYTARRNKDVPRQRFQQKVIEVEYPHRQVGRKY